MGPTPHPAHPAYFAADELLSCSPLGQINSPISCTSAETFQGAAWAGKPAVPVSVGAAQQQGLSSRIGCKRKAGCQTDLTPCSSLADLSGCQTEAARPITFPTDAASPRFRQEPKRFHSLTGPSTEHKAEWGSESSCLQSEFDLSLLLDVDAPAPACHQEDAAALLCCEEGLEGCEDVSLEGARLGMGGDCSSPRAWEGTSEPRPDARCRSASTSDSQHSEGASFVLPKQVFSHDIDATTSSEESAVIDPYAMSNTPSPSGNFIYRHVPEESLIGCMAAMYGFTPFTISVGTAYFERIAARDHTLLAAARATPEFAAFVAVTPLEPASPCGHSIGAAHMHLGPKHWLTAVHLACIYVAAKNVEFVPYKKLLSTMLSHVHHREVPANAAAELELEVLEALNWRLGPFYRPAVSP